MRLYHVTTAQAAKAILSSGFRDATGTYSTDRAWRGVWLSDVPLDANDHGRLNADTILEVDTCVSEAAFVSYQWIEEGKSYREWLIPAAVLNPLIKEITIAQ